MTIYFRPVNNLINKMGEEKLRLTEGHPKFALCLFLCMQVSIIRKCLQFDLKIQMIRP